MRVGIVVRIFLLFLAFVVPYLIVAVEDEVVFDDEKAEQASSQTVEVQERESKVDEVVDSPVKDKVSTKSTGVDENGEPDYSFLRSSDDEDDEDDETEVFPDLVDRLESIRKLWKREPIIALDDRPNILRDLIEESAPEGFAVLFTASSDGCKNMLDNFQLIAKGYWEELEKKRSVSTARLFFFAANATKDTRIFRDHKMQKVPTLVYIPKFAAYPVRGDSFPAEWIMDPTISSTYDMKTFLELRSNLTIPLKANSGSAFVDKAVGKIEDWGMLIIFVQLAGIALSNISRFRTKNAWLCISLTIFFVSMSGTIYCLLRGCPPFAYSQQHGLMFIYPDRGSQFFFEGIMIGVLNCSVSLLFVIGADLSMGVDKLKAIEDWFDGEELRQNHRETREARMKRLVKNAYICISVAMIINFNIFIIYRRKAPWYQPFRWSL